MNKHVITAILSVKLCIFLLIFIAYFLLPFGTRFYYPNFLYPSRAPITLQTAYKTWDAQHYIYVSENGYHKNDDNANAFPPLFPFMIYLFTFVTRSSFVSGIVLSNIFSCIAFYAFYILVKNQYSEKIAWRSLTLLLLFPTSFYFSLIYTESLFFLLVVLFFLFLQKKKLFFASFMAFLMPLTRLIGIAIFLPFLFSYILEYSKHSLYDELRRIGKTFMQKKSILLIAPVLGLFTAMLIFFLTTGDFFAQFTAQRTFLSHDSVFSILNPWIFLQALFTFPLAIHGISNSLIDRLFFLCFLFLLPCMYKRVSKVLFLYALLFGLLPVLSGSFISYTRYLVIVFPLFIMFAKMSYEKRYETFIFPFFYLSMLMQTLFLIMHSLNYWVA